MLADSELQELLDRARIADTIYAFCDYCDRGDVEAVVGLFAEDGVMDLGGGAVHIGRPELRDMFADRFALYKSTTFHCSGVRLVSYDGATAATTTYLYGIHDAARLDRQMHVWGRYEDEMVNDAGVWRFLRRDLHVSGLSHTAIQEVPDRFGRAGHGPRPPRQPDIPPRGASEAPGVTHSIRDERTPAPGAAQDTAGGVLRSLRTGVRRP
jgi:ketosteroid isomerase-like protein